MKQTKKIVLVILVVSIWIAVLILYAVSLGLNCLDVKEDYENNPQLASDKHGFESFEEWAEEEKMHSSCFPRNQGGGFT